MGLPKAFGTKLDVVDTALDIQILGSGVSSNMTYKAFCDGDYDPRCADNLQRQARPFLSRYFKLAFFRLVFNQPLFTGTNNSFCAINDRTVACKNQQRGLTRLVCSSRLFESHRFGQSSEDATGVPLHLLSWSDIESAQGMYMESTKAGTSSGLALAQIFKHSL